MRVSDVNNNSQASLIAQQQAAAAQQQSQLNANMQFVLEAQRAIDRMAEQVEEVRQTAERDKVRDDDHRRSPDQRSGQTPTRGGAPPRPTPTRPRVSDGITGKVIDIEA